MTTINLEEITHYNTERINEFLELSSDSIFEVIYPKIIEDIDDNTSIAFEYFNATLTGEKLAALSRKLSYLVPAAHFDDNFSFIVQVNNMAAFASTLHYLAKSLDHGSNYFFQFQDDLSSLLQGWAQNTIKPFCMGLFWTGLQYQ